MRLTLVYSCRFEFGMGMRPCIATHVLEYYCPFYSRINDSNLVFPVPPSLPANLAATEVNFTATRVTWALTNPTADAGADTLTLTVRYSETIDEYLLAGNETALLIAVIPGTEYEFALTARNQDGSATTQPALYQTPPGGNYSTLIVPLCSISYMANSPISSDIG